MNIFKQIKKWFDTPVRLGVATTIEGQRVTIKAEDREAYEESAARLIKVAQAGKRPFPRK